MNGVDEKTRTLPVTIITGFLGSGKTTLLTEIIRESSGKKIAVIQNEVSEEMGIESSLLTDSDGNIIPDFFELPNGCVCCSAKNDMVLALENIVNLGRDRIDAIVVETTGVADPCSVAEIFWVDTALESSVHLDGILAVVDCLNFHKVLEEGHFLHHGEVGRRQVAISDRVILNKTDLVDLERVQEVRSLVKKLNPTAEMMETCRSRVKASWVLEIGSFTANRNVSQLDHLPHHLSTVDHVLVKLRKGSLLEKSKIERFLAKILWEESSGYEIFRSKGVFQSVDKKWYLSQSVGALFEITPVPSIDQILAREAVGKFLFIGNNLNESEISSELFS